MLGSQWFQRLPKGYFAKVNKGLESVSIHPDPERDVGSNSWIVSGEHTEHGHVMVANDTHLSLGNPAVFFDMHLNTIRAGGDIDIAGVCFPGIPSAILGRNLQAAWGATVYYADVSDVYIETLTAGDPPTALFNGEQVPLTIRQEVFEYSVPGSETCEDWPDDFIKGTVHSVEEVEGKCVLTVDIWEVPHHGPVIPGSVEALEGGLMTALSWRWTGFEPSSDFRTLYGFMRMTSPDDFLAALEHFGVGAQNWVYGDVNGHLAYGTFARLPIRQQLEGDGPVEFPVFLPVPGDGCCEWVGDVPLEQMPHAIDPEPGYLFACNGDAFGYTLDGDPFNDPTYQGYSFDIGFRAGRAQELLQAGIAAGGQMTVADMQQFQADHHSPLGAALTPHILDAVTAAEAAKAGEVDSDPVLAEFADDPRVIEARDRLQGWTFAAASGALPDATDDEKADAVATSVFNAWVVSVTQRVVGPRMEADFPLQFAGRFLINLFTQPAGLATYDEQIGDSLLWDDPDTTEMESRNFAILAALVDALDFLENPEQVGIEAEGGFGTSNMEEWLWGKLHTLTLKSVVDATFNIPSPAEFPDGYPRWGDNYNLDASNVGFSDTNFTFKDGPAIRNVYTLDPAGQLAETVIPGGQDGSFLGDHYSDQFDLWSVNETHPLVGDVDSLVPVAESCYRLEP